MRFLKRFFTTPTAAMLAQRELEDAERELLAALSAAEYATNMAKYHRGRLERLRDMLSIAQ